MLACVASGRYACLLPQSVLALMTLPETALANRCAGDHPAYLAPGFSTAASASGASCCKAPRTAKLKRKQRPTRRGRTRALPTNAEAFWRYSINPSDRIAFARSRL